MALSISDQLAQLNSARNIVLSDPSLYPQIVDGILPIVGAKALLELRRWGAEFLAETLGSPVVSAKSKEQMGISALSTMKDILEMPGEQDTTVVKGIIQASASIYGHIFKYIIDNPSDIPVWNNMAAIKSNILKRWDSAPIGVRVCCIKFVQKVVQMQTPGANADPRRPEQNETSIAIVPRDHPLIPPPKLEPEASGLLDRLLDIFHQDNGDVALVTATLNCLPTLIRTRPSIANKIVSAILNFNPLKRANSPMTPKIELQIKSMESTTRALLLNMYRSNENSPIAARIKQYVDRMRQSRREIFGEGAPRKRALPSEPTDGLDNSKRRRLGAEMPAPQGAPLQPNGPNTLAQLFTLTNDATLASFDVKQLPEHIVVPIANGLLAHVNKAELDNAVTSVRARLLSLEKALQPPTLGDDEEDYEPALAPNEDREQILNRADALPPEHAPQAQPDIALGPFQLPQPPPLTHEEAKEVGRTTIARVFSMMDVLEESSAAKRRKLGLNRLAGSNYDREAWITFITRLATRGSTDIYDDEDPPAGSQDLIKRTGEPVSLSDVVRDNLWRYIMEDFRARMPTAISWLNEEWFNDKMQQKAYDSRKSKDEKRPLPKQHYETWTLKLLDGIMPYLDAKDKLLIRFLSEVPVVGEAVISRVKSLARDPERVDLCVRALHYLILMKPPARNVSLDALEDLYLNYDDAKAPAAKVLQKWRPYVLPSSLPPPQKTENPPPTGSAGQGQEVVKDLRSPPPSSASAGQVATKAGDLNNEGTGTGRAVAAAG